MRREQPGFSLGIYSSLQDLQVSNLTVGFERTLLGLLCSLNCFGYANDRQDKGGNICSSLDNVFILNSL